MILQSTLAAFVDCRRALHLPLLLVLALAPPLVHSQATIRSLTGVIEGHQVGGIAVDRVGNLYIADFGDVLWKMTPEGDRQLFATGLYGTSGNAVDSRGNLLQSSFYGDFITRIDRQGQATPLLTTGLSGPVGLAVDGHTGDIYIANCRGNTISRLSPEHALTTFAQSELFHCPNGLALDDKGNLYVANFRDNRMLEVDAHGTVTLFATVSGKGLGHLCFRKDRLYVTAYGAHEIYEVTLQGTARRILGNGERGMVDGADPKARLSFPNGIACDPWSPRLYINEYLGDPDDQPPRRMIVREITLAPGTT